MCDSGDGTDECMYVCAYGSESSGEKTYQLTFNRTIPDRKKTIAMELQMANQWIWVSLICR